MAHRVLIVGSILGLIAVSEAIAADGPAKCYDWITHGKVRGGYLSAGDPRSGVAQMRAVGMNTVMPKFGGLQDRKSVV